MISGLIKAKGERTYEDKSLERHISRPQPFSSLSEKNNNVLFIAFPLAFFALHLPFALQNSSAAMCPLPIHRVLRLGMCEILVDVSHFVLAPSVVVARRRWLF
jgi:hypothetical protein